MSQRKAWTKQEDQLLIKIMSENELDDSNKKWKWNQIGDRITQLSNTKVRSGKQCRQRWFNQLHPDINKESQWTKEEEEQLFKLQSQYGNKWAKIATHIPGRSDNNIKNYFYSTLRKAIRRVNNYVTYHKRSVVYKNLKAFQSNTLNKILTVAQNRADRKIIVGKQCASSLAKDIRDSLIQIQTAYTETQINHLNHLMDALITKMQDFNKICKRRKTKKKDIPNQQNSASQNQQPSLHFISNIQSSQPFKQPIPPQSQTPLQIQLAKDKNENKPLREQDSGQYKVVRQKSLCFKQVESQDIEDDKKIRQPVIPSIQGYNSFRVLPLPYQSLARTQQSQSLQSNSLHYDQSFNLHAPSLNYIPYVQPNIFTGSAFIPTPFYHHPFMSFPPPLSSPAHNNGFQAGWSQQYTGNKDGQISSFLKTTLNILQSNSEIKKEQQ